MKMQIRKVVMGLFVGIVGVVAAACGGGETNEDSITSCTDGVCSSISEAESGNFTIGTYIENDDSSNMPTLSASGDTISITCSGSGTTGAGSLAYFDCNLAGYDGYDINVWCDHGEVINNYNGASYTTGCASLNYYCTEEYGLRAAGSCSTTSALVKDEISPSDDVSFDEWLETLEPLSE